MEFVKIGDKPYTYSDILDIYNEILEKAEATLKAIWNQTKTDQLLFNPENTEFQWPNHHFQKLLK